MEKKIEHKKDKVELYKDKNDKWRWIRKKISSKDVKTLAGYTLQAASRRGKSKSGCQKKGK